MGSFRLYIIQIFNIGALQSSSYFKFLGKVTLCLVLGQVFSSPLKAQPQNQSQNQSQTQTQTDSSRSSPLDLHVCGECHGEQGSPKDKKLPIIWGQSAQYLEKQLRDYRSGQRENQIMNSMAESVPKKELSLFAQALASQPWPPRTPIEDTGESMSPVTKADAQTCLTCHAQNADGESVYKGAPRLNGQNADYLLDQMLAWMNQDRANSEVMGSLLRNKKKEELQALSLYFAGH